MTRTKKIKDPTETKVAVLGCIGNASRTVDEISDVTMIPAYRIRAALVTLRGWGWVTSDGARHAKTIKGVVDIEMVERKLASQRKHAGRRPQPKVQVAAPAPSTPPIVWGRTWKDERDDVVAFLRTVAVINTLIAGAHKGKGRPQP